MRKEESTRTVPGDFWARLNADNQKQAGNFLQFLLSQQEAQAAEDVKSKKSKVQYDVLKGKIRVYDNFDDPLPEFEEYM